MPGFRCGVCGRLHRHDSRDIAFGLPDSVFEMATEERERRAWISSDVCVVDGDAHFLRGMLNVPISTDGGRCGWGVWAHVTAEDARRYFDVWGTDAELTAPPFAGHLANEIHPYPGFIGLAVRVQLQGGPARPHFTVVGDGHRLGADQQRGVTAAQAAEMLATYHHEPPPPTWTDRLRAVAAQSTGRRCNHGP